MLIGRSESREVELNGAILLHLLKAAFTSRELARLLMISKALQHLILSDQQLHERYWKTKTKHYFYNINRQYSTMPGANWETRFSQLQEKNNQHLHERIASLLSAARSNDLPQLKKLCLKRKELFSGDFSGSIYHTIAKNRHQPMMDYVFNDIVMPSYQSQNNKIIGGNDTAGRNIFHHAAMLNQLIIFKREKATTSTVACLNEYVTHYIVLENIVSMYIVHLSPLHLAARFGSTTIIQTCITQHNINPNLQYPNRNYTPLHEASRAGNCASIATLLELGANIDVSDNQYTSDTNEFLSLTPLDLAILHGHFKAFKLLIQHGANTSPESLPKLLSFAILGGNVKILNTIICLGNVDINAISILKKPLLHVAATNGNYYVFKRLLALGANPNTITSEGNTLLHSAAVGKSASIFKLAAKHMNPCINLNAINTANETPLQLAIKATTHLGDETAIVNTINAMQAAASTTLFAQPNKRSSESEGPAAKHLKI